MRPTSTTTPAQHCKQHKSGRRRRTPCPNWLRTGNSVYFFGSKLAESSLRHSHTGCTTAVVDAVENPVGFHSTTSAVSSAFLSLRLSRREISFHEPLETAGILLDEWEPSRSETWVFERELRKAFNCSSTNAGVPDVGAIGRAIRLVDSRRKFWSQSWCCRVIPLARGSLVILCVQKESKTMRALLSMRTCHRI
jgi:hypothetical protein